MSESLKTRIDAAMKEAMRARDKQRLGAIRLIQADCKRIEVDERIELDDARVLAVLDKMAKQRKDSVRQYEAAEREDLAAQERFELDVIAEFLPEQLADDEIDALIAKAVAETGAASMADMGKVMAVLRSEVQGRADMGQVSARVRAHLGN